MSRKRIVLYGVAAFVLLSVGAGLGKGKPAPTQDIGTAATATASPTATLEPTPSPTPEPTPTAVAGTPYSEWLARSAVFSRIGNLFGDVSDAATANDIPLVVISLRVLGKAIDDEVAWLESHDPEPCWSDIWDLTHAGMSIQSSAVHALTTYWDSWPYGSDLALNKALADIDTSNQMIQQGSNMIETACL